MAIDYLHPNEAFLRNIDIHELLPQQEPFVMVVISSITEVIVAYLLGVVSGMGLEGIFIAYAVDNALRAAVLCMVWKRYTSHGKRASVRMS